MATTPPTPPPTTPSTRPQTSTNFSNPAVCASQPNVLVFNASAAEWPAVDAKHDASVKTTIALIVLGAASVAVFVACKPKYDRMRVRPFIVPYLAFLGLVFFLFASLLPDMFNITTLPCWVRGFLAICVVPCVGIAAALRYTYFILLHRFALSVAAFGGRLVQTSSDNGKTNNNEDGGGGGDGDANPAQPTTLRTKLKANLDWLIKSNIYATNMVLGPQPSRSQAEQLRRSLTREDQILMLQLLKFTLSPVGQSYVACMASLPHFIVNVAYIAAAEPVYYAGCVACFVPARSLQTFIICQVVFFLVALVFLGYRTRGLVDHFGFFGEGRITTLYILIGASLYLSYTFRTWPTPEWFNPAIVTSVFFYLILWRATITPVLTSWWADRKRQRKQGLRGALRRPKQPWQQQGKQHPSETSGAVPASSALESSQHQITLQYVLADPKLRAAFTKRVDEEFCPELLTFVDVVSEWELGFIDIAPTARLARAKRIAQAFVGQGALQEINVSDGVVARVRKQLAEAALDPSRLTDHVFEEAKKEVIQLLELGPLSRFVETPEFLELSASGERDATSNNTVTVSLSRVAHSGATAGDAVAATRGGGNATTGGGGFVDVSPTGLGGKVDAAAASIDVVVGVLAPSSSSSASAAAAVVKSMRSETMTQGESSLS